MEYRKLEELIDIRTGKLDVNASSENGKYPFFTCSKDILKIDTYSYDCECVLLAGNGELNVKYYNGKFDAYQRTYILESNSNIISVKYLYYFMQKYIETLRNQAIGGVIKYIKLSNINEAMIPIYSTKEQEDIIKEIGQIEQIINIRRKQFEELDKVIKSQFVKMFGNPVLNEKGFKIVKLRECLSSIDNGKSFICENFSRNDEYPAILKLSAVTYGNFNQDENKALIDKKMFIPKCEVHKGDLLFTRKNTPDLVGMSAFVYETKPHLMMPDIIFRINTFNNCNKIYLWQLINHTYFRNNIKLISNGSAKSMSNISKEKLMNLKIILPPIELQNQFADIVRQIDKQKFEIQKSLEEMQNLQESLMNKYFG